MLKRNAEVARFSLYCADAWRKMEDAGNKEYDAKCLRLDLVREMKKARVELTKEKEKASIPAPLYSAVMQVIWNTASAPPA